MSDVYSKALRDVASTVSTFRTGTVTTNLAAPDQTYVALDNDPTATPVRALALDGIFESGTRVGLLSYPPRGLVILGRFDGEGTFSSASVAPLGGILTIGPLAGAHLNINANQIWALNGAAASPLFLNFNSSGAVNIGDGTTSGAGLVSVRMRPIAAEGGNIAPTTGSTTYVSLGTTATDVAIPYSPSGILEVTFGGAVQYNVSSPAQFALVSFEIRDTNAAGTLRLAASDDRCLLSAGAPVAMNFSSERTYLASGLPTSGTAFVRPMFRVTSSNMTLSRPYCIVKPVV